MDTELVPGSRVARHDGRVLAELRQLGLPGNLSVGMPHFLKLGNEYGEYYRVIRCNDEEELIIVRAAIARAGFSTPVDRLAEPSVRPVAWWERLRNWIHRL